MSKIIDDFYTSIHEFIKKSEIQDIDRTYDRTTINQVFAHIAEAIQSFQDCPNEDIYCQPSNIATIQYSHPVTGYKLYMPLTQDNYKEFYFECLMYSLIHYELFFKNYKYTITSSTDDKSGEFEITEDQLPHLLGIDAKFIGKCALLDSIILNYSSKNKIEQLLALVENHKAIMEYENSYNLNIFNYYKAMLKVKEFLLLGRFFNGFEYAGNKLNIVEVENNPSSSNQIYLTKKSNLNSTMTKNIIKILLQKNPNGLFFARSLQSTCDTIEGNNKFCGDVANNYLTMDIPVEAQKELIEANLLCPPSQRGIKPNQNLSINPAAFWKGVPAGVPHIKLDDLQKFINYLNTQKYQTEEPSM